MPNLYDLLVTLPYNIDKNNYQEIIDFSLNEDILSDRQKLYF